MPPVRATVWLPEEMWKAVQLLAADEGDANTVVLRAVEEYLLRSHRRRRRAQSAKYKKLVDALSTPVSALNLSVRAASALTQMNIHYVCELVVLEPRDLVMRKNLGQRSFQEIQDKLKALGLSLGMTLDGPSYTSAALATVAARITSATE
jgi:hypothetical protein